MPLCHIKSPISQNDSDPSESASNWLRGENKQTVSVEAEVYLRGAGMYTGM